MRIFALPWLLLGLVGVSLASGCRSAPFGEIDRANAHAHLDQAEADVRAGEFERALEHLSAVHDVGGLEPDLRVREQRLIDQAARGRFAELAEASSEELEEIFDSNLPEDIRARAGLLAADRLIAENRRVKAFRMVKKVDQELPGHPERVLAGDVLARAGLSLIRDERRYYLLFRYRPRGVQTLEYLVVNYPLEPRCPEAYFALSEVYERQGDLDEAIERSQDLCLYHPGSPYSIGAGARLPYLRLYRLKRDDFDRGELLRAQAELVRWLARHPDHELSGWVEGLLGQCRLRLVRSDLYLAGYYRKTDVPAGQRLHAERARALALEGGFTVEAAAAEDFLAELHPAPPPAGLPTPP